MAIASFEIENTNEFLAKALAWADQFQEFAYFNANQYGDVYSKFNSILAVHAKDEFVSDGNDTFIKIENFKAKYPQQWIPGFFSYDLKNEIEDLTTKFPNPLDFPDAYFFIPKYLLSFTDRAVSIQADDPKSVFDNIVAVYQNKEHKTVGRFRKRMTKDEYATAFNHLLNHIKKGDIYEVNLCQEFYIEDLHIDPIGTYRKLNNLSPTPFSVLFKYQDRYILSATPERFLAKRNDKIISQPIKGTIKRGVNMEDDVALMIALQNNPKEISENLMIVDLVRNDLTRSAVQGSVNVERQLEIQSFQQVHQLVSTVSCRKNPKLTDLDVIRNTFPPGSMTGAPKISAMQLCERYENSRRGIYSGSVGYFSADGDFDFNVIIRSLLYNKKTGYLSFHTGGAITHASEMEKEYAECLLKAEAILKVFGTDLEE